MKKKKFTAKVPDLNNKKVRNEITKRLLDYFIQKAMLKKGRQLNKNDTTKYTIAA
jgi:hypothetical protein